MTKTVKAMDYDSLDYVDDNTAIYKGEGFTGKVFLSESSETDVQYFIDGLPEGPEYTLSSSGVLLSYANCYQGGRWIGPRHEWDEKGRLLLEEATDSHGTKRIARRWDENGNSLRNDVFPPHPRSVEEVDGNLVPWRTRPRSIDITGRPDARVWQAVDISLLETKGELSYHEGSPFCGEAYVWDQQGQFITCTFVSGIEDGPYTVWSTNGKVIVLGVRRHPCGPVGPWHRWDEEGRLCEETIFDALGNRIIKREFDEENFLIGEEYFPPKKLMIDPESRKKIPAPWL